MEQFYDFGNHSKFNIDFFFFFNTFFLISFFKKLNLIIKFSDIYPVMVTCLNLLSRMKLKKKKQQKEKKEKKEKYKKGKICSLHFSWETLFARLLRE